MKFDPECLARPITVATARRYEYPLPSAATSTINFRAPYHPEPEPPEPLFGTHVREALAILRALYRRS